MGPTPPIVKYFTWQTFVIRGRLRGVLHIRHVIKRQLSIIIISDTTKSFGLVGYRLRYSISHLFGPQRLTKLDI